MVMSMAKATDLLLTVKLFAPILNASKIPIFSTSHQTNLETAEIALFAPLLMLAKIREKSYGTYRHTKHPAAIEGPYWDRVG